MGAFVPLNSGAQVELLFTLGGVVVENRLWFIYDTPPFGSLELQGLANGVADWHVNNVLPLLSVDITLASVVAYDWTVPGRSVFELASPNAAGGTNSPTYSANVAVLVPFRWPIGVRERRNGNYVPGIPDSAVTLNTVDPTWSGMMFDAYAALVDLTRMFYPIETWRWVNTSGVDGGLPRSEMVWGDVEGPSFVQPFKIGQRRQRLK